MTYLRSPIVPGPEAGPPTAGKYKRGQMVLDKTGRLWFCFAGDGTSVGTWVVKNELFVYEEASPPANLLASDFAVKLSS